MSKVLIFCFLCAICRAQQDPTATDSTWTLRDFRFHTGEQLPELKLHYVTLGTPQRDASGHVRNAVLILHGAASSSVPFLSSAFLGALFLEGQSLDARKYFLILPDAIGHGDSSKPSDGLH